MDAEKQQKLDSKNQKRQALLDDEAMNDDDVDLALNEELQDK